MAKLYLSASKNFDGQGNTLLLISVTNSSGAPVTRLKASTFSVSRLTLSAGNTFGFENATPLNFSALGSFYAMQLPPRQVPDSDAFPLLAIAVKRFRVLPSNARSIEEGYITLSET